MASLVLLLTIDACSNDGRGTGEAAGSATRFDKSAGPIALTVASKTSFATLGMKVDEKDGNSLLLDVDLTVMVHSDAPTDPESAIYEYSFSLATDRREPLRLGSSTGTTMYELRLDPRMSSWAALLFEDEPADSVTLNRVHGAPEER